MLLLFDCASSSLTKRWKNPDVITFKPKNILVIGVTPDIKARKYFEFQLVKKLNSRQVNALQSHVVFEKSFQDSEKTETEIEAQVEKLISKGYDAILISVVKGVENNVSYSGSSSKLDYRLRKFIGYYLAYQDAYFKQGYYKNYRVFTIETSLYGLNYNVNKQLIWSGTYDIIDLANNQKTINTYVKKIIKALERESYIQKNDSK